MHNLQCTSNKAQGTIGGQTTRRYNARSKKDFVSKMNIVKETVDWEYWLELLYETDYLEKSEFSSIMSDCEKLNRLLIAIVKISKTT